MSLSVAVVTSTQGRPTIRKAIESVQNQTRKAAHYVFIHGADYSDKTVPHLSPDTIAVHTLGQTVVVVMAWLLFTLLLLML